MQLHLRYFISFVSDQFSTGLSAFWTFYKNRKRFFYRKGTVRPENVPVLFHVFQYLGKVILLFFICGFRTIRYKKWSSNCNSWSLMFEKWYNISSATGGSLKIWIQWRPNDIVWPGSIVGVEIKLNRFVYKQSLKDMLGIGDLHAVILLLKCCTVVVQNKFLVELFTRC